MAWTKRQRSPTPFSTAFSCATSTASASLSPPITGPLPQLGHGDREDAAAAADIDGVGRLGAIERRQQLQAAARRRMRAGAESHAGIDAQRQQAGRHALGIMRGMDPERTDGERLERALVLGHPIAVGQLLPVPAGADAPPRPRPRSPSPKISMRHGPSRETSRLVTTKPFSARCSSACSRAARSAAGTSSQAVQTLTPPR